LFRRYRRPASDPKMQFDIPLSGLVEDLLERSKLPLHVSTFSAKVICAKVICSPEYFVPWQITRLQFRTAEIILVFG
jgi:hypothetical protein